jgi:hypothetical protein
MKNIFPIYIIALCILIAFEYSCQKESRLDCLKRTGKPTTETRTLPPFTKIYLKGNIDLFVKQGNTQSIKIETGSNLISLIKTKVDSGILHISNENRCNWARSYKNGSIKIFVTIPTLRFIWHYGSGTIISKNTLICDTLDIWAHQTGNVELFVTANIIHTNMHTTADITLHGTSNLLGNWHVGEGHLKCEDLNTDIMWTESNASGDEYFNVKTNLTATIGWIGNVHYLGDPHITLKGEGKGKLIHN